MVREEGNKGRKREAGRENEKRGGGGWKGGRDRGGGRERGRGGGRGKGGEIVGERGSRGGESRRQKRDSNMEAAI